MPSDLDRSGQLTNAGTPSGSATKGDTESDVDVTTPPVAPTAAPLPQAKRRSASRAAWSALIVGIVVLVFLLIFVLQNNVPAQFTFWAWTFTLPSGVAMLFAAIGGALVTAMVGTARMFVLGRRVRNLELHRDDAP
jgi:uncharacterized integral membrane protein